MRNSLYVRTERPSLEQFSLRCSASSGPAPTGPACLARRGNPPGRNRRAEGDRGSMRYPLPRTTGVIPTTVDRGMHPAGVGPSSRDRAPKSPRGITAVCLPGDPCRRRLRRRRGRSPRRTHRVRSRCGPTTSRRGRFDRTNRRAEVLPAGHPPSYDPCGADDPWRKNTLADVGGTTRRVPVSVRTGDRGSTARQGGGARHRPHASLARGTRSPYTLNKESGTPNRFLVHYTNAKSALAI